MDRYTMSNQRIIGCIVRAGLDYIQSGRITQTDALDSDCILIELFCETLLIDANTLSTVYYKYENHIHDTIEALLNK